MQAQQNQTDQEASRLPGFLASGFRLQASGFRLQASGKKKPAPATGSGYICA